MCAKAIEKQGEKRKAIMDAALKLFCEKCFQDTSTASISQEAKVATGTLFLYFESKEELINHLYLESKEEYAAYVEEGVCDRKTFKQRLKHIWERSIQWHLDNPNKVQFMVQFWSSPLITKMTREKAMNRLTLVTEVVKQAVTNKEVSTTSVEWLSAVVSGHISTSARFIIDNPQPKNLQKWLDEGFEFLWKGIQR